MATLRFPSQVSTAFLRLGGHVSRDSNLSPQGVDQQPYRCTTKTIGKVWWEVILDLTIHMT